MRVIHFPKQQEFKVFEDALVAEGFKTLTEANEYIALQTGQTLHDVYVMYSKTTEWEHLTTFVGDDEAVESFKNTVYNQGNGSLIRKIRSEVRHVKGGKFFDEDKQPKLNTNMYVLYNEMEDDLVKVWQSGPALIIEGFEEAHKVCRLLEKPVNVADLTALERKRLVAELDKYGREYIWKAV